MLGPNVDKGKKEHNSWGDAIKKGKMTNIWGGEKNKPPTLLDNRKNERLGA